jgi:hypothetical protein
MKRVYDLLPISDVLTLSGDPLRRVAPLPKSGSSTFGSVLSNIRAFAGGLGDAIGISELPTDLIGLLQQQIELQMQMQTISSISNIEHTAHEMRMAPVRNFRLG